MATPVSGKVWLVTGASSGTGLGIAVAALHAGHKVVATARNVEKARSDHPEVEQLGGRWLRLDVTDKATQMIVEGVVRDEDGRVDVVVNNAGVTHGGVIEDLSEEEIYDAMNVDFFGPVRVIKGVIDSMVSHRSGTIVNMSSIFAQSPQSGCFAYIAAKSALEGLSEGIAADYGGLGIRVLILEPGLFRTNVFGSFVPSPKGFPQHFLDSTKSETPLFFGHVAQYPEEVMVGDPAKLGQRVVETVDGTGMAEGIDRRHMRLVLGPDAMERIREKMTGLQENLEAIESMAMSTNFDQFGRAADRGCSRAQREAIMRANGVDI